MKSIWGRAPQYAHAITDGVLVHARRLRRQVGTDDLFLLAVAGLTEDAAARRALEAEGLTEERLLGEVRADADGEGPFEFLTWAPACYILQGGRRAWRPRSGTGGSPPSTS